MADNNLKKKNSSQNKTAQAEKYKKHASKWSGTPQGISGGKLVLPIVGIILLTVLACLIGGGLRKDNADCPLQISEVMSTNTTSLFLQDGSVPDWIEIRNVSDESVELSGYALVTESAPTNIFTFSTHRLEAGAYLLVYADNNTAAGSNHAPFRLRSGSERLVLLDQSGDAVDMAEIPAMEKDQSFARDTDGSWNITDTSTPGEVNSIRRYGNEQSGETVLNLKAGALEISEIMSDNATWFADENGEYHDYIEIHNTSDETVNLNGWYLTDNIHKLARWQFPGVKLPADGYLVVHCSGKDLKSSAEHLHTNFKIADRGDVIILTDPKGASVSMVEVPLLETDQAYSKTSESWSAVKVPSPGVANVQDTGIITRSMGDVYISEILAMGSASADWIEIYNGGSKAVDISNWGLSDNAGRPRKWQFPEGAVINPGQYIQVFCDGSNASSGGMLCTNFALSADGGYSVTLSDSQGVIMDRLPVDVQFADISYGREADKTSVRYYDILTPGMPNSAASYLGRAASAKYSVRGGLYKSGDRFSVTLSAEPGQRIYYTLDCTDPTESSTLYTGPIEISGTTMLRTRVYADGHLPSYMDGCTYLYDAKNGNGSVYVVSLISDPRNLTSDETGIMVKGNHNNYMQEWEREAHVEVFDAQGTLLVSQECGVRQQGQTSRAEPQQSLKFVADSQYGSDIFKGKIFSEREDDWCRSFLMRTSNDDQYGARMRDSILTSLAGATDDLLYQKTEVAVAYINGEYWGHYNLRETSNEDFICQMEGWVGQEREFDYVRGNRTLIQGSDETYKNLLAWLQSNPADTEEAYNRITSTVDVKNYLEYITIQIYVGNTEPSDIKRYRNANDDGLWRWVLFDLDWGFHRDVNSVNDWATPGGAGYRNKTDNTLFVACLNNPTLRDQFLTHFGEQLATTFSPESMGERLQARRDILMTILPDHFERWDGSLSRYERKFGEVVSYANKRPYKLMMYFKYDEILQLSQADFEKYFGEAMKVLGITYAEIPKPE